jgi:hypothetical protein
MPRRKKKPVPEDLTRDEKNQVWRWHCRRYSHHFKNRGDRRGFLDDAFEAALDWCRANARTYADYPAFVRNWIRRDMTRLGYQPSKPPSSAPLSPRAAQSLAERKTKPLQSVGQIAMSIVDESRQA